MRKKETKKVESKKQEKHGQNITLAAMGMQFWELIGTQKASVNEKLGTLIDANEGDVIEIVNDMKPEEKQQFMAQSRPQVRGVIAGGIRTGIPQEEEDTETDEEEEE